MIAPADIPSRSPAWVTGRLLSPSICSCRSGVLSWGCVSKSHTLLRSKNWQNSTQFFTEKWGIQKGFRTNWHALPRRMIKRKSPLPPDSNALYKEKIRTELPRNETLDNCKNLTLQDVLGHAVQVKNSWFQRHNQRNYIQKNKASSRDVCSTLNGQEEPKLIAMNVNSKFSQDDLLKLWLFLH